MLFSTPNANLSGMMILFFCTKIRIVFHGIEAFSSFVSRFSRPTAAPLHWYHLCWMICSNLIAVWGKRNSFDHTCLWTWNGTFRIILLKQASPSWADPSAVGANSRRSSCVPAVTSCLMQGGVFMFHSLFVSPFEQVDELTRRAQWKFTVNPKQLKSSLFSISRIKGESRPNGKGWKQRRSRAHR